MIRIVSGGQTGVDRAALDAALEHGAAAGGWCPLGRKAEDGVIPGRYPLQELPRAGYRQRTKRNVIDSDATLIIYFDTPTGGTEQTLLFCLQQKKPYLLLDGEEIAPQRAALRIIRFVQERQVRILNVAGPRASGDARAYPYAREVVARYLALP
jgi:hypothetical protein